jgi:hypothetical protein
LCDESHRYNNSSPFLKGKTFSATPKKLERPISVGQKKIVITPTSHPHFLTPTYEVGVVTSNADKLRLIGFALQRFNDGNQD